MEYALLKYYMDLLRNYVSTRTDPTKKHMSDVRHEYYVVSRMRCACGKCAYVVEGQRLVLGKVPADQLSIRCSACGNERVLEFPLNAFYEFDVDNK